MTTPPQGPWGPGQPGGQPGGQQGGQGGQGGWGQQPPSQGGGGWGQPQQPQPQQPQPQQGQPPQQGGGGWGQQPGRPQPGQPEQPAQPEQSQPAQGWGQRSPQQPQQGQPAQGGAYQQQGWGQQGGQQSGQQGGWHQQQGGQPGQQPWQQGGGSKGSGGGLGKDKMPLLIGGGVVGILLIGLLIFLVVKGLGGDDEPAAGPGSSQGTGDGGPGNAAGQAEGVTQKLQSAGYQCSDLFNNESGAHRGCFKYEGSTQSDAVFQFTKDGSIISVQITTRDEENGNNAKVTFDGALQAIGNDAFGGSEVRKIQDAVATGQKSERVGTTWGEFRLSNDSTVSLAGRKSGEEAFKVPDVAWATTEAQLKAGLTAKGYTCKIVCEKKIGDFDRQTIYGFGGSSGGLRQVEMEIRAREDQAKAAWPATVTDAFGVLKAADSAKLKEFADKHTDGKATVAYVAGWRIEVTNRDNDDRWARSIRIKRETYYP